MNHHGDPDMQGPEHKSRRPGWKAVSLLLVLSLAGVGIYAGYAVRTSCEAQAVDAASVLLVRQRDRYDHTYQFATSASQDAIVRPVAELQQILMDTQEMGVPACLQTAKNELIGYMGTVIGAFQAYGAQETDSVVRDLITQSEGHYDNFAAEMETVKECAPFCIP